MTIGGWSLGNAWLAWVVARRWQWTLVYADLIYLWLFGVLQTLILIAFRGRVNLAHPVAWLYVLTLLVNVITAIVGFWDLMRAKPSYVRFAQETTAAQRAGTVGFVIFVGFLAIYGLIAQIGWPGTQGGIFPEEMSLFTLRSFGAFYFSLAVGALPLTRERNLSTLLNHAFASYGLIVFITAAAFFYIRLFDFVQRPGGLAYFGAYIISGIILLILMLRSGTGLEKPKHEGHYGYEGKNRLDR
jgi:hypothetical protein